MRDIISKLEELNIEKPLVKEGNMSDMAQEVEKDHEVQMARNDLYKSAKYAVAIHKMMKDISEMEGIDGWVAAKITKAADYLGSVKHYMEGQMMADVELAVVPVAGDMTDAMTVPEEDAVEVGESVNEDVSIGDHVKVKGQDIEGKVIADHGNMVVIRDEDAETDDDELEFRKSDLVLSKRINENPMADLLKNLPKNKATNPQASSEQDMISKIIAKLPRDDAEKGIDGPAKTMPDTDPKQPAKPPVPMQRKQAIANKMARDPYGADRTASFGTMKNWSKK